MPEATTVRGMTDHDDLYGPGKEPLGGSGVTERDRVYRGPGDPSDNASSRRYVLETRSTSLGDVTYRVAVADEDDD